MPRTKPTTRKPPTRPQATSLTVDLPGGGTATFRAEHELTPRHTRPLETLTTSMMPLMRRVAAARNLTQDGETVDTSDVLPGVDVEITEEQAERMSRLNDVAILAYLKSWTLDADEPTTVEELLDIPLPVYEALRTKAATLFAEGQQGGDQFSVDSLPDDLEQADPDLPTSA